MEHEYTIDPDRKVELKERLRRKILKVIIPSLMLVVLFTVSQNINKVDMMIWFYSIIVPIILLYISYASVHKVMKQYDQYKIITTDSGIESHFQVRKVIEWKNLEYNTKSSGEIIAFNKTKSWLSRQLNSSFTIVIHPELKDLNRLKILLETKTNRN